MKQAVQERDAATEHRLRNLTGVLNYKPGTATGVRRSDLSDAGCGQVRTKTRDLKLGLDGFLIKPDQDLGGLRMPFHSWRGYADRELAALVGNIGERKRSQQKV